jgi:hypothetical protein
MNFLSLSKSPLLLKIWFYTETPGSFQKLTSIPLVHRKYPGKKKGKEIGSLAIGRRRLRPIPGESAAGWAGESVGEACGLTLGRFVTGVGVEGQPAAALVDARRRRRLQKLRLRREGRTARARCSAGRSRE